jgi:hypothetical protein
MEEILIKYGEKIGIFAICVYLIWSDQRERREWRAFIRHLLETKEKK